MLERCYDKKHKAYKNYGGRGIKVNIGRREFVSWYLSTVSDDMIQPTVDRIENDGDYEINNIQIISRSDNAKKMLTENPRWDVKINNMNKANDRRSISITIDGKEYKSVRLASREAGVSREIISKALKQTGAVNFRSIPVTYLTLEKI